MTFQEAIRESRNKQLVSDNKFDRHIKRSIESDKKSRKAIFIQQTETPKHYEDSLT
jgi:hypothetical protein